MNDSAAYLGPGRPGAPTDRRRPRALLFDWDDTLSDSWGAIHAATNTTLAHMGLAEQSFDTTRTTVRRSLREDFPERFGERWQEAMAIFREHYAAHHLASVTALAGADAMLADLARHDLHLAIVSNKTGVFLRAEVAELGWTDSFAHVIGAGDAVRDKPAIDPVAMALAESGIEAGPEVWFVGDSPIDMECAHAAGCTPVLIRERAPAPARFGDHPPAIVVENCPALQNLVGGL